MGVGSGRFDTADRAVGSDAVETSAEVAVTASYHFRLMRPHIVLEDFEWSG